MCNSFKCEVLCLVLLRGYVVSRNVERLFRLHHAAGPASSPATSSRAHRLFFPYCLCRERDSAWTSSLLSFLVKDSISIPCCVTSLYAVGGGEGSDSAHAQTRAPAAAAGVDDGEASRATSAPVSIVELKLRRGAGGVEVRNV